MEVESYFALSQSAQYYECGFDCDNAIVLKTPESKFFFTDMRYVLEAKQNVIKGVEVVDSAELCTSLAKAIKKLNLTTLGFDSLEVSLDFYHSLCAHLGKLGAKCELVAMPNFHQHLRVCKSESQIALIRQSQKLNKKAFKKFADFLSCAIVDKKPLSEQNLHFYASTFLSMNGKYELSFNPIIGINATGAKPHALPSAEITLNKNDLLLFDAGIKFKHYCSDMTRTARVGKNMDFSKEQKFKNKKQQKIYDIVRKAQENAITKARVGMKAKEIDSLARKCIESAGYGEFFVHSTGHGIGLDIHELPRISARSEMVIEEGMVFSIEPGIYLGDEFGVRIEDLVVMRNGVAEVL
ncbi:M24 family metallopeptidase [Helicobacter himalayensis]|uniref:M24 family metallopeptidase n=1 Tax=Helicobacter himalayensis TaxID=1591088 RepID=UPI00082A49FB|nr:M24 family metallopeptidase [Helicobacter himalayensis]